ncbi:MAG: PEP/pyruvate-binding domain-containing protein [Candidatus Limnocylindrales bacterium]
MDPQGSRCIVALVGLVVKGTLVRRLRDVRLADAPRIGNKAAMLGELIAAGVRVPDGVVLDWAAAALPAADREALLQSAAEELGGESFAVRSSGVSEDGADRSFAGLYETVLNVRASELGGAFETVVGSVRNAPVDRYDPGSSDEMAVIVQKMVHAVAAGVALTADPVTGDRSTCVVTAVKGVGAPLVGGEVPGEEWRVRDRRATLTRRLENAIDAETALAVADVARRIAQLRDSPQDVEWALGRDGFLWIVQARPMTALPPEVSWTAPAPGAFSRSYRFGEWIAEPVTPLFESWLLSGMENRLHAILRKELGQVAPQPYHVVVHGWYFYSVNWASPKTVARNLPRLLLKAIRDPRRVAGILPATARHSVGVFEQDWRSELQPRYRAAVATAEARVERHVVGELPGLIDDLAGLAGEYFTSIAALSGAAYKLELNLASFYAAHLRDSVGWSHLPLLAGFDPPAGAQGPAVVSLDWWHEPLAAGPDGGTRRSTNPRVVTERHAAEAASEAALKGSPRRLRQFRRLLREAQHLISIREEQTQELTLPWPVLRRAVVRLGEELVALGRISAADDIFFLTREEVLGGLAGPTAGEVDIEARRTLHAQQARLVPPLLLGDVPPLVARMLHGFTKTVGARQSDRALVSGTPASAGRATGLVRVIRGADEFGDLQLGEILVAPLTAPAWTSLFSRAAGVVTDVGSAAAHASLIAREFGIPAIVGTGDATQRLRTGMRVTVDGGTGTVELAWQNQEGPAEAGPSLHSGLDYG